MKITDIIESQYKQFSHYVIESRAIPRLSDGLKPVQRRALWAAKKIAKDWTKVSKLAGATMSNHPHGNVSIEDSISGMAQKFAGANNVCFFEGDGTFGSRITGPGNGISSARYVSVKLSKEFHELFDVDSELIKQIPNYDETDTEPSTFLPIVPAILVNPSSGIAVGFACNILSRDFAEVKKAQIAHLEGKKIKSLTPHYDGFKGKIEKGAEPEQWNCYGVFERINDLTIKITELPIGMNRENFVIHLDKLEEKEIVKDYEDYSKDEFEFIVKLKEPIKSDEDLIAKFKLVATLNENITLIGFNDEVRERMTDSEVIMEFTDWRFSFYLDRYKKLLAETSDELEFKRALMLVITKGLFKKFPSQSKKEITESLEDEKIASNHITRILQIPIYRFGKEEVDVLKDEIKELEKNEKEYTVLVKSEDKRKEVYIKELKELKS
jgi:DNA topoisomerase II